MSKVYDGQKKRSDIIIENMNLVHHIAHKMYIPPHAYYSYEDIVQEGMIGLIKAVDNFNPDLGFTFSTYASPMIKGYMMRFIRENQNKLKYSRHDIDAYAKVIRTGKLVSELSPEDLEELEIKPNQLAAVISMMGETSLDDTFYTNNEDNELSLIDMIPSNSAELSDEYYEVQMEMIKDKVLERFGDDFHRDLIDEWYYSQLIDTPAKQMYLARKYKISQPQVGRIIRRFKNEMIKLLTKYGYEVSDYLEE